MRGAVFVRREQAAVAPQCCADEFGGLARRRAPRRIAEHARRPRHAFDHQRVPAHENFLVAARMHAQFARSEKLGARGIEQSLRASGRQFQAFGDDAERFGYAQMPRFVLEIRPHVESPVQGRHRVFVGA